MSIPTISANGLSYIFTIRQDARFATGRDCTAGDVAYSLARVLSPGVNSPLGRRYFGDIVGAGAVEAGRRDSLSGVKVLTRLTLRIRLARPDADFLARLATPEGAVVDRFALRAGRIDTWLGPPSGLGAWTIGGRKKLDIDVHSLIKY